MNQDIGHRVVREYRRDLQTNEIVSKPITEIAKTSNNKSVITLREISDEWKRVQVKDKNGNMLQEVFSMEEITDKTKYYVDYNYGNVYFHMDVAGKEMQLDYYGIGGEYLSYKAVFTRLDLDGNVIETLADIIDGGRDAIDAIKVFGNVTNIITRIEDNLAKMEELGVGGRNLWRDSKVSLSGATIEDLGENHITGQTQCYKITALNYGRVGFALSPTYSARFNQPVTFSAWVKYENVTQGTYSSNIFQIFLLNISEKNSSTGATKTTTVTLGRGTGTKDWHKVAYTHDFSNKDYDLRTINVYCRLAEPSSGTAWVTGIKAEFGTIPTDWTPAPEDVQLKIDKKLSTTGGTMTGNIVMGTKSIVGATGNPLIADFGNGNVCIGAGTDADGNPGILYLGYKTGGYKTEYCRLSSPLVVSGSNVQVLGIDGTHYVPNGRGYKTYLTDGTIDSMFCCATNDNYIYGSYRRPMYFYSSADPRVKVGENGTNCTMYHTGNLELLVNKLYPVGSIKLTINNKNPSTTIGGTWELVGQGECLVGVGTGKDKNGVSKTFTAGGNDGEYQHTQTVNELVPHNHAQAVTASNGNGSIQRTDYETDSSVGTAYPQGCDTYHTGGGQPFNITNPTFGVYVWKRTA